MSIHSKMIKGDVHVTYQIKKAAVLGSGVMGSGIAAHLANIGIPTLLLDIVPKELTEEEEAKGLTLKISKCEIDLQQSHSKIIKAKTSTTNIQEKS